MGTSHQWMFVTDTTDAVYPPESWSPYAIMDRLSEILSKTALVRWSFPFGLSLCLILVVIVVPEYVTVIHLVTPYARPSISVRRRWPAVIDGIEAASGW
jgi:hypothetical protein